MISCSDSREPTPSPEERLNTAIRELRAFAALKRLDEDAATDAIDALGLFWNSHREKSREELRKYAFGIVKNKQVDSVRNAVKRKNRGEVTLDASVVEAMTGQVGSAGRMEQQELSKLLYEGLSAVAQTQDEKLAAEYVSRRMATGEFPTLDELGLELWHYNPTGRRQKANRLLVKLLKRLATWLREHGLEKADFLK